MKVGDFFVIITATDKYAGATTGQIGQIEKIYRGDGNNIAVRIGYMRNVGSSKGLYYFTEEELRPVTVDYVNILKSKISSQKMILNSIYGITGLKATPIDDIKDVKFNGPATIVFWSDNTKTVVKAHDEVFDPEKGLAMAIVKRLFGNTKEYYYQIKHWTKRYKEEKRNDV